MGDTYRTIGKQGHSVHRVLGSKHLGFAIPIHSEAEAKECLITFRDKYHDAHHVCYAFRCGRVDVQRNSDDGEPSGTAGKPIAGAILSAGITQVLVIVVRYFGGTKLGTGGLIQAYKTAAQEAIEDARVVEDEWLDKVLITCDYQDLPQVMMMLKHLSAVKMDLQQSENCQLSYLLSPGKTEQLMAHSVAWKSAVVTISPVI
jgi:uncharacterized YigZ family protein